MGLATGWALKRRGHEPVVYEQFEVGNPHGSSHGRSRIFRLAYPEDHFVRPGAGGPRPLARARGRDGRDDPRTAGARRGRAHTRGEHGAKRWSAAAWPGSASTARRPSAATRSASPRDRSRSCRPEAGDRARRTGRSRPSAASWTCASDTRAHPDDVDAGVVVVTAGSWVNELLEESLPVKVTREDLCYFNLDGDRADPVRGLVQAGPAPARQMYSLYDPVYGLKVGAHHQGGEAGPERTDRPAGGADRAHHRWANQTVPARRSPARRGPDMPVHDQQPTRASSLERRGRIVVGSPCSGHGFKFAPAIGERLAAARDRNRDRARLRTHSTTTHNEQGIATGWLPGKTLRARARAGARAGASPPGRRSQAWCSAPTCAGPSRPPSSPSRAAENPAPPGCPASRVQLRRPQRQADRRGGGDQARPNRERRFRRARAIGTWSTGPASSSRTSCGEHDGERTLLIAHSANRWAIEHLVYGNPARRRDRGSRSPGSRVGVHARRASGDYSLAVPTYQIRGESREASRPVPRQRDAADRGGHGPRGLLGQRVDPLPPDLAVPRHGARRLRADRARRMGARRATRTGTSRRWASTPRATAITGRSC
jgi:sarcosine oxidase